MNERRIYRYEIPVDDSWHTLALSGPIVHVGCRRSLIVEVWAFATDAEPTLRAFRVFGTGQPIPPAAAAHVGTVFDGGGQFVWHLMEHGNPGGVDAS